MANQILLVDSNIIIYSIVERSPKHEKARAFMEQLSLSLVVSHQNILESLRVLTHKTYPYPLEPRMALKKIASAIEGRVKIAPNTLSIQIALELIAKHNLTGNNIFDAYLAGTALSWGIQAIATDNEKDFQKFKEIKVYNPFK